MKRFFVLLCAALTLSLLLSGTALANIGKPLPPTIRTYHVGR